MGDVTSQPLLSQLQEGRGLGPWRSRALPSVCVCVSNRPQAAAGSPLAPLLTPPLPPVPLTLSEDAWSAWWREGATHVPWGPGLSACPAGFDPWPSAP